MYSQLPSRSSSKPFEPMVKRLLYARLSCVTEQSITPQLQHKTRTVDTLYLTSCISSLCLQERSLLIIILPFHLRRTSSILTPHRNTESTSYHLELKPLLVMASEKHRTFREIMAHTAKCEKCGKHNTSILYRCMDCSFPICTPCWNAEGGTGRHRNVAITESPVILPPLPPNKTKKTKKDKPATTIARPRKNVVISDSEPDDSDMPDAAAKMGKSKQRSMIVKTEYTAASSNDEDPKEVQNAITNNNPEALTGLQYSEDVLRAADLLLGFFHAADTPTSASSATSCSTNSGLAAVLNATGTIERQPNPSPRQQKPSATFTSDPATRLYELNKQYPRHEHPPLVPEEGHDDVEMYDHGSASSFTPINARQEIVKPRVPSLHHSVESSKSLAKTPKDTRNSPTDRFIRHARPERPREATNGDKDARGMQISDNRYEETDSDVEIVAERKVSHFEPIGPSFGDGGWNPNRSEFEITDCGL